MNAEKPIGKVWDVPMRIFHWVLVTSIVGALVTLAQANLLRWHVFFGQTAVTMVVFRLIWGFVGSRHARFASFLRGPSQVLAYAKGLLRGRAPETTGHNPVAALVLMSMLALVAALAVTGVMILGGKEGVAPWAAWFTYPQAHWAKELHEGFSGMLLGLIGMHLGGMMLHRWLTGENVALSMLHGRKRLQGPDIKNPPTFNRCWLAVAGIGLTLALWLGVQFGIPFTYTNRYTRAALRETAGTPLPANTSLIARLNMVPTLFARESRGDPKSLASSVDPVWSRECGACHHAFHPSLLPARSWRSMLANLEDHFGESAWVDESTQTALLRFALANSAEDSGSEASRFLLAGIPAHKVPWSITEQPGWKRRHHDLDEEDFKTPPAKGRLDCAACHRFAKFGSFENEHILFPF